MPAHAQECMVTMLKGKLFRRLVGIEVWLLEHTNTLGKHKGGMLVDVFLKKIDIFLIYPYLVTLCLLEIYFKH